MSQNPFHSQDSLFRFDASGNLVVNFNELNSQRQPIQDDPSPYLHASRPINLNTATENKATREILVVYLI